MRYTEYEERAKRMKVIDPEYVWLDGNFHALVAWPLIVDIKPGETVAPSAWRIMKAPDFGKEYELWHYVYDGLHVDYRFMEA